MTRLLLLATLVALLAGAPVPDAAAQAQVEFHDGHVTARFDSASTPEVLAAIRRATQVEIVVPPAARDKKVTLAVNHVPFERFLRRLLEALDLGGFALVYEPTGTASRIIVVDRRGGTATPAPPVDLTPPVATPPPPTTGAGPIYIPPTTPPVYIPPTTAPVYIPPKEPPVYIPPAREPQYVPPPAPPTQ